MGCKSSDSGAKTTKKYRFHKSFSQISSENNSKLPAIEEPGCLGRRGCSRPGHTFASPRVGERFIEALTVIGAIESK